MLRIKYVALYFQRMHSDSFAILKNRHHHKPGTHFPDLFDGTVFIYGSSPIENLALCRQFEKFKIDAYIALRILATSLVR